jgi:hypothetical protein
MELCNGLQFLIMKYIITESRLENIIFKYLDDKFEGVELKKGKYCDIVFAFPGEEFGLIAWNSPDELFTLLDLINDIGFMFSMDRSDVLDVIGRYVESRYNLKVNSNLILLSVNSSLLKVKVGE